MCIIVRSVLINNAKKPIYRYNNMHILQINMFSSARNRKPECTGF